MATATATFKNGVDAGASYGQTQRIDVLGTWAAGDTWELTLSDLSGKYTAGAGRVRGAVPTCVLAFKNRVWFVAGDVLFFSGVGQPTEYEQQCASAGFVQLTNNSGTSENGLGLSSYQGKLAVFSRRGIQIWETNADPSQFAQSQVLPNIGTLANYSVQAVGDMDVYFLADSGVRSLRVRDSSNNAQVVDIGTPIDTTLQDVLATLTETQKGAACAVVEPTQNRYWLFLKDTVYVLSYFPSAGICAWSTFKCVGSAGETFVVVKFAVLQGKVYALDSAGRVWAYGGSNGNTYDSTAVKWKIPWLSANTPGTRKTARGFHAAFEGVWMLKFGMDPDSGVMREVARGKRSTFGGGNITAPGSGTHFCVEGESSGTGYKRFSHLLFFYDEAETKG